MNTLQKSVLCALAVALLSAGGYGLYQLGTHHAPSASASAVVVGSEMAMPSTEADPTSSIAAGEAATRRHIKDGLKAGSVDPANGKPVLYYHDPMVPGKRFDAPAKSPFMDMMLVPVYGDTGRSTANEKDSGGVRVSPRMQQNLGLRTAEVVQGSLSPLLSAEGNITWNERDQSVIQARATGFIEKLYVRATLDAVRAGQPFADIYVPDWVAAQAEYLALKKIPGLDAPLLAAARQRMRLVGMSEAQIDHVDTSGQPQARTTLTVPSSGVVAELAARVGMTVMQGTVLARINGLSTVWAIAELPESQAALVHPGMRVEAKSVSGVSDLAGTVFKGTVQVLLPEVDIATRTRKARIELRNPQGILTPGMFVNLQFTAAGTQLALLVPSEALIATGERTVVMVAQDGGKFSPVTVETGTEADGKTEIRKGLKAGQRVVVSGQFLIDSEASLKGVEARLNTENTVMQGDKP